VTAAALIAGFGVAGLIYGPIGTPVHQKSGTTLGAPPKGVVFGNALEVLASSLNLSGAGGFANWNWTNATGNFTGPCNASGILNLTGGGHYVYNNTNGTGDNISAGGGNVTLVCLNSVGAVGGSLGGTLNATWYYNSTGVRQTFNSYNATDFMSNGSYLNNSFGNVSSCNQWGTPANNTAWNLTHVLNATTGDLNAPCQTYYEMNNNTTWLTSFGGAWNGTNYVNSTVWSPNQVGYAPNDVIYAVPVIFTNGSINGTYAINIGVGGVTPVAQTFYFNDSIGGTTAAPDTVLFTFDMTAAWLFDASLNMSGMPTPVNASEIYGEIGAVSIVVTECAGGSYCPIAVPQGL